LKLDIVISVLNLEFLLSADFEKVHHIMSYSLLGPHGTDNFFKVMGYVMK